MKKINKIYSNFIQDKIKKNGINSTYIQELIILEKYLTNGFYNIFGKKHNYN